MKLGLRNIRALLRSVNNPHKNIKTIHIAGTNGKGSTSSMIAAVLTAAGYKVGLYTSPHLVKFNERIRVNGRMISDNDIVRYTKILKPTIKKIKATFFEATTAIAFKYFADQKVDIAVIETGLGGRLDSTNVVRPIVSVITSIGKDHIEQLGNTFESIAFEKAGIIKKDVPAVLGKINSRAKKVIIQVAKKKSSPIVHSEKITLPDDIEIELKGKHQISNAKAALAAINIVTQKFLIGNNAVCEGFKNTTKLTGLRGRFEIINSKPKILLDVAHNPDGIKTLIKELKKLSNKKFVIIFATMKDKDYRPSLIQFGQINATIIATQPNLDRALSYLELFEECKRLRLKCFHVSTVKKAVVLGMQKVGRNGLLVITGSHFLVGEAIPLID